MISRNGIKWNREETILAFDLYCRIPFGKIGQANPDIIQLANLLGRTPGSVALKMHNLAHFDPELRERNVVAMAHGSKLDEEISAEFANNWTELSYEAQKIRASMQKVEIVDLIDLGDVDQMPPGEYREQSVKTRVGQYFFRLAVLNSYNYKCCVTGLNKPELLIASHIKPWKDSDAKKERTNPRNGLCLNALHDKAFDKGLITIDKNYNMVISSQLKKSEMDDDTKAWFLKYNGKKIILPDRFYPDKDFIEYHNDFVFKG